MPLNVGLGCASLLRANLPELIEIAARHGFATITVRPVAFVEAINAGLSERALRQRLSDAGLTVTLLDALLNVLPGVPALDSLDPATRTTLPIDVLNAPDIDTCFRCAETLGASIINVVHYRGTMQPVQLMGDAVGAICRRAESFGLTISLEVLPESGLPSLDFAQQVIAVSGAPNCGITLDFFHLDRSGGTIEDIHRLAPGRIANIQVSDRTAPSSNVALKPLTGRQMPGEGQIPLRSLTQAALANSPDATIDLEVLNEELRNLSMDEAAARLAEGAKYFAAIVDAA